MSLNLQYLSAVAPLVTATDYGKLVKNYEKFGKLPARLRIAGIALDESLNENLWQIAPAGIKKVAQQMIGGQIRKNHSKDRIEDIIGKVDKAWEEGGKVFFEGEIADEDTIKKVLLGYVRFTSVQIGAPFLLCRNCLLNRGIAEKEAQIESIELPCSRCGSREIYVTEPQFVEQSIVTLPAYPNAQIIPIGLAASMNLVLKKRFGTPAPAPADHSQEVLMMAKAMAQNTALIAQLFEAIQRTRESI